MHELAVCQALLTEVGRVARDAGAGPVQRVVLRVGPLSGIEPELLSRAFEVARAGIADRAELCIELSPVRVRCHDCGAEREVPPNRLTCRDCGSRHTELRAGDELILQRVEFAAAAAAA